MNTNFSTDEYNAAVQREREARAARVRQFIAEHEESEIADLFDAMRDIIDEREDTEVFCLSKFFGQVRGIFDSLEETLCN